MKIEYILIVVMLIAVFVGGFFLFRTPEPLDEQEQIKVELENLFREIEVTKNHEILDLNKKYKMLVQKVKNKKIFQMYVLPMNITIIYSGDCAKRKVYWEDKMYVVEFYDRKDDRG